MFGQSLMWGGGELGVAGQRAVTIKGQQAVTVSNTFPLRSSHPSKVPLSIAWGRGL